MSRRHKAEKREVNPDPKFGDLVLTKFMNAVMVQGKKSEAEASHEVFDGVPTERPALQNATI